MLIYIFKRLLFFIPTLFIISLVVFFISIHAPGDPVEQIANLNQQESFVDKFNAERNYLQARRALGLDLPLFYFSVSSLAACDTLYKIPYKEHREALSLLTHRYGNWEQIAAYYFSLRQLDAAVYYRAPEPSVATSVIGIKQNTGDLFIHTNDETIRYLFAELQVIHSSNTLRHLEGLLEATQHAYEQMLMRQTKWKNYIPVVHYHGFHNQYHRWIVKFMRGDFGISYQDKRPVATVIWDALKVTLAMSCIAVILTYILAIPLGVIAATAKGKLRDKMITFLLFMLFSLPNFWIATLLITFLGGGDYLNWFPAYGWSSLPPDAPWMERVADTMYHLVLPIICWVYPNLAFLSYQARGGMLGVLNQDYIRTARAKGLAEAKVVWKHSFRNSLLPLITLLARVFPVIIGGSLILENIFSIPGMGKLALEAIMARNYPVVYTVILFSAILTLMGYLAADVLYAVADPRIIYKKEK